MENRTYKQALEIVKNLPRSPYRIEDGAMVRISDGKRFSFLRRLGELEIPWKDGLYLRTIQVGPDFTGKMVVYSD